MSNLFDTNGNKRNYSWNRGRTSRPRPKLKSNDYIIIDDYEM